MFISYDEILLDIRNLYFKTSLDSIARETYYK